MQKRGGRFAREPYFRWEIANMVLAAAILVLAVLIFLGTAREILIPVAFLLGSVMSAISGILNFSGGSRVFGYICSVFAGILAVALIFSIVRFWIF